ncbi:MAG: hypothetical protein IJ764_00875 [Bacteroidales bacterium]|nr:hypothetical protein [Bacteroidales bacterium]
MKRYLLFLATLACMAVCNDAVAVVHDTVFRTETLSGTSDAEYSGLGLRVSLGDIREVKLLGFIQSHYDYWREGAVDGNDFNIKRAIFMADAKLSSHLSFWLMVDAASPTASKFMHEYYAQYAFSKAVKVRVGQFKQPLTLENVKPLFFLGEVNMNESVRYFAGVQGDDLYGNYAGRDQGVMVTGDLLPAEDNRSWLSYSAGLFNGAGLNMRDNNRYKDFVGMLNLNLPYRLTLSTSCLLGHGTARLASPVNTLLVGEDYRRLRWSAGLEWHSKRVDVRSEWIEGRDGKVNGRGGYAEVCVHTLPRMDVVLDYDYLNRNTSLSKADQLATGTWSQTNNYTIGIQYWIHRLCRIATQYVFCNRQTGDDQHQWVTQFQIVF